MSLLDVALFAAIAVGAVGGPFLVERRRWHRRRGRALRELAAERGLHYLVRGGLGVPEVSGLVDGLPIRMVPASLSLRGREREWMLVVSRSRLARRTTLRVSLEGGLHRVTGALGGRDIEVGRKHFDERFRIEGSEPDVIRGVLEKSSVRATLVNLFFGPEVARCELWEGALYVDVKHPVQSEEPIGRTFDRVLTLARALEEAADVAPVAEARAPEPPRAPPGGSLGGGSGAPVGVPVFEES